MTKYLTIKRLCFACVLVLVVLAGCQRIQVEKEPTCRQGDSTCMEQQFDRLGFTQPQLQVTPQFSLLFNWL